MEFQMQTADSSVVIEKHLQSAKEMLLLPSQQDKEMAVGVTWNEALDRTGGAGHVIEHRELVEILKT